MKKTNKIISSLLVLAMVLSTLVGVIVPTAAAPVTLTDDETGTVDTTGCTAVSTADQFFAMENGGKYYLANDIDLRGRKDFTNVTAFAEEYGADRALIVYTVENVVTADKLSKLR